MSKQNTDRTPRTAIDIFSVIALAILALCCLALLACMFYMITLMRDPLMANVFLIVNIALLAAPVWIATYAVKIYQKKF